MLATMIPNTTNTINYSVVQDDSNQTPIGRTTTDFAEARDRAQRDANVTGRKRYVLWFEPRHGTTCQVIYPENPSRELLADAAYAGRDIATRAFDLGFCAGRSERLSPVASKTHEALETLVRRYFACNWKPEHEHAEDVAFRCGRFCGVFSDWVH